MAYEIERLGSAIYNTVTGGAENLRTPTVFKNAVMIPTVTQTTVWAPSATKRYRLMGYNITVGMDAAGATNAVTVSVLDAGGGPTIATHQLFVPTSGLTTTPGTIVVANIVLPGNGYLAFSTASFLRLQTNAALTAGTFQINAYGTEELG